MKNVNKQFSWYRIVYERFDLSLFTVPLKRFFSACFLLRYRGLLFITFYLQFFISFCFSGKKLYSFEAMWAIPLWYVKTKDIKLNSKNRYIILYTTMKFRRKLVLLWMTFSSLVYGAYSGKFFRLLWSLYNRLC